MRKFVTITGLKLDIDCVGIESEVIARLLVDVINDKLEKQFPSHAPKLSITKESKITVVEPVILPEN